jgi:CMP-N,N'-diacetyllegionaminic acid synthase
LSVVAVIPARGGSTRVPRKNLALLGGVPLIVHTIRAAREAAEVDRVVVSTEDAEIAAVALAHGADLVWRPAGLATSEAPTEPALQHAVLEVERRGYAVEALVLLQATSPLRGAARIDEAVRLWRRTGCDAVVSVVEDRHYYFLGELDSDARLTVGYDPLRRLRTQEIAPRYRENGAIYVMTRAQIIDRGCRMGGDTRGVVMEELESLDIDTPLELQLCEAVLASVGQRPLTPTAAWPLSPEPGLR